MVIQFAPQDSEITPPSFPQSVRRESIAVLIVMAPVKFQ